jgi:hypothetical protein
MGDKAMLWNHNDFYAPERPFMHLTVCCWFCGYLYVIIYTKNSYMYLSRN